MPTNTSHTSLSRLTRFFRQFAVAACFACAAAPLAPAHAQALLVPHPGLDPIPDELWTKQLGEFGESFVEEGLRARGYTVSNGNVGNTGIDRIAVKRGPDGRLIDVRIIEVKTRQTGTDFPLDTTKTHGKQLSDEWITHNLERIAADHPDAATRRLAKEILRERKLRPWIVRRELHGISVQGNKYLIQNVDDLGRVTGTIAEGRVTDQLSKLASRGTTAETRAAAVRHLAKYDQLAKATSGGAKVILTNPWWPPYGPDPFPGPPRRPWPRTPQTPDFPILRATRGPRVTTTNAPQAVIVRDQTAAREAIKALAKSPGVVAGAVTFVIDEGFTAWEYYNGTINTATYQQQSVDNAIKAAAVGAATGVVYLCMSTPHGLVLAGVAIVTYLAADWAISAYNDAFGSKPIHLDELTGLIPMECLNFPMIDDFVASGTRRE